MARTPKNVPVEEGIDFMPVVQQGMAAKELGMTEANCPYAEGEYREAWISGLIAIDVDATGLVN